MSLHKPSGAQLRYASVLGIDVPDGISSAELSRLINHASDALAAERAGMTHHPAHVVARALGRRPLPNAFLRAVTGYVRAQGIRRGSLVEQVSSGKTYVVTDFVTGGQLRLHRIDSTYSHDARAGWQDGDRFVPSFRAVYNPSPGYMHPLCISPPSARQAVAERLAPTERYRNEHGEFWLCGAAERILADLEREQQIRAEEREAARAAAAHRKHGLRKRGEGEPLPRFCVACGTEFVDRTSHHHMWKCTSCSGSKRQVPSEPHCSKCGHQFTPTAQGPGRWFCPDHRQTKNWS